MENGSYAPDILRGGGFLSRERATLSKKGVILKTRQRASKIRPYFFTVLGDMP
jgi:hypothetical protein